MHVREFFVQEIQKIRCLLAASPIRVPPRLEFVVTVKKHIAPAAIQVRDYFGYTASNQESAMLIAIGSFLGRFPVNDEKT